MPVAMCRLFRRRGELNGAPTADVGGKLTLTHGRNMLVQTFGTPHVQGPLVKFAKGTAVPAGSVVLVLGTDAPDAAAANAAAAVLTGETAQIRARWDSTAATTRVTPQTGRPWRVTLDAAAFLSLSQATDGTIVTLDADIKPGYTWNAIAKLPGSDPKMSGDVILITSHLDHLGVRGNGADVINNGADDDASGTTAVMVLAEALAKSRRPKRTVIFACFGSEESGGAGARHFLDHPPAPLETMVANLEFEMIARPDAKVPPHTLWLTGYERSDLGPELAKQGARIVADPHPEQNFFARSDNIQLAYRGVVAQTVSSFGLHKEYHTPADDLSHVDWAHMTDAIRSMLAPVVWLSNSPFRPAWKNGMKPSAPAGRGRGGAPAGASVGGGFLPRRNSSKSLKRQMAVVFPQKGEEALVVLRRHVEELHAQAAVAAFHFAGASVQRLEDGVRLGGSPAEVVRQHHGTQVHLTHARAKRAPSSADVAVIIS